MKKLLLVLFCTLFCTSVFAQNKDAIIQGFLRSVGETDTTTGSVTGAIARNWMNEFFREASYYGVFMRETVYVTAADRDTFILPSDFLFAQQVRKGRDVRSAPAPKGKNRYFELSDSAPSFFERIDTVVVSTVRPDTALPGDVVGITYCYKKNATDKVLRPLIYVPPDSLEKLGRALATRTLPPEFLSERLDTIIPSITQPINLMRSDVFDIRAAYRKEAGTGKLIYMVKIPAESLARVANTASDYFYFSGQSTPRIVFGQKKTFADTVYAEVLVASDFYTYIGLPTPSIRFGKTPTTADTCFCQVRAINPMYGFIANDTSIHKVERPVEKFLTLTPPAVRAETLWVNYAAMIDTAATATDSSRPIMSMETAVRPAIGQYLREQYYRKKGFTADADYWFGRWHELLTRHAITRGIRIALPAGK